MSSKAGLRQQQLDWATATSRRPDSRGYLASYDLNLFQPLTAAAHRSFTDGSGSELLPAESCPEKMAALHSSSALAVNAFDYWSGKPLSSIASALGIKQSPSDFRFEAQFPTGLGGKPPNLDLAFLYPDNHILGVESKFSEWLEPRSNAHFKAKYFPGHTLVWSQAGLPRAQSLADEMQRQKRVFRHLDAAQLLKHMLGLAIAAPGQTSLLYLFFDYPGQESSIHRAEIEEFAEGVGSDMPFYWATYQQFFGKLRAELGEEHRPYLDYVSRRYCQGATY